MQVISSTVLHKVRLLKSVRTSWRHFCIVSSRYSHNTSSNDENDAIQKSALDIQMLSKCLHQQIFRHSSKNKAELSDSQYNAIQNHLYRFGLWGKSTTESPNVNLQLPNLHGQNIDEHFRHIAKEQAKPYLSLIQELVTEKVPRLPKKWRYKEGISFQFLRDPFMKNELFL